MQIVPPFLKNGDTVAIVSPSGVVEPGPVESATDLIRKWGLNVIHGQSILAVAGTFAGTDEQRISDLQKAVNNPMVKAIICTRGGYGLSRIIDRIDFSPLAASPKWIVGYSDITVMHLWVSALYGIATIHGEMPLNYRNPEKSARSVTSVRDLLFGRETTYEWEGHITRPASARGIVTGGNLALMYSLSGTIGRPDTDGKVLFIEDTGEYYYSVDRMLHSLRLSGMISNLAALLVGDFGDLRDSTVPFGKSVKEIVDDVTADFDYPVYHGFPAGHCPDNVAFFLGREALLSADGTMLRMEYP